MNTTPDLTQLRLKEFRLNGFVVLPGLLPPGAVEAFHQELLPILRGEFAAATRGEGSALRGPSRIAFDLTRYQKLLDGPFYQEMFTQNPVAEDLVGRILAPAGGWRRGWTQVECPFPGAVPMTWHPDQTLDETPDLTAPNRTVRVTFNIPLVDFTPENGAMEVIPGSHLLPRSELAFPFETLPRLYPVSLGLKQGDVLLRDGNMLHRGTANRSSGPRPMLDQTYKAAGRRG